TNFSCSSSGLNLTNITFYLWNATVLTYNETRNSSGTFNITAFNYTLPVEIGYFWNCRGSNNNSVYSFSASNFSITLDIIKPTINLTSPADGYSETSSSATIIFSYNATDNNNVSNCSLIVNGAVNTVNITINSSSITSTFSAGSYVWSVNCSDFAGNIINSTNRSFTITAPAACTSCGGGGGGGGGGSTASTFVPSDNQIVSGYTNQLKEDSVIKFNLLDETETGKVIASSSSNSYSHTLTLDSISSNSVKIIIRSSPINITLFVGEAKKLNISSSINYDLYVKLNSIVNNVANLTIKTISEPIKFAANTNSANNSTISEEVVNDESVETNNLFSNAKIYIYAGIGVGIGVLVYLIIKKKSNKVELKKKKR
ncbi:MAG: hypothetical protein AABX17_04385, partial [Nanoarchaeota archaeon]